MLIKSRLTTWALRRSLFVVRIVSETSLSVLFGIMGDYVFNISHGFFL
jgi:hypothetical protein